MYVSHAMTFVYNTVKSLQSFKMNNELLTKVLNHNYAPIERVTGFITFK